MHACVICIDANARVHFNAAKQVMEANIGFQEDMTRKSKNDKIRCRQRDCGC